MQIGQRQDRIPESYTYSVHARKRMSQRGISKAAVQLALSYGRMIHGKGARCHVIGRKEIRAYSSCGVNLTTADGVHVLISCNPHESSIITVYRNRSLSGIKSFIRRRNQYRELKP